MKILNKLKIRAFRLFYNKALYQIWLHNFIAIYRSLVKERGYSLDLEFIIVKYYLTNTDALAAAKDYFIEHDTTT